LPKFCGQLLESIFAARLETADSVGVQARAARIEPLVYQVLWLAKGTAKCTMTAPLHMQAAGRVSATAKTDPHRPIVELMAEGIPAGSSKASKGAGMWL